MTTNEKGPKAVSQGSLRHAVVKRLRFTKKLSRFASSTPFDPKRLAECSALLAGYGEVK